MAASSAFHCKSGCLSFLSSTTYLGSIIDGDKATIALEMTGSPRPIQIELVKENGVWTIEREHWHYIS